MKEAEKPEFKKYHDDLEVRHFTRQLVHSLLLQSGYDKLYMDETPTTSALELNPIDPLSNLLNLQIYVPERNIPKVAKRRRENRSELNDSDSTKPDESES